MLKFEEYFTSELDLLVAVSRSKCDATAQPHSSQLFPKMFLETVKMRLVSRGYYDPN
jgi:hypothetical protein